jgi:hypothetical protein
MKFKNDNEGPTTTIGPSLQARHREGVPKSIALYLRRDIKSIPVVSSILRISVILIELGVTAIGLLVAIARLDRKSGLGELTNAGDYLGWLLLADVILALLLALFVERRRWIRNLSLIFHVVLVAVSVYAVIGFYFNPND